MYSRIIENLVDKKVAILGFGKEGISTYNFIRRYLKDKELTIIDANEDLLKTCEFLSNDSNVSLVLGEGYLDNLNDYDIIIKSPGVRLKDIDITPFKDKLTSQVALVLEVFKSNIIGITGSKGKSTTTSLIYQILKEQGKSTYLLGNIGIPIFDYIDQFKEDDYLVIEMAALQLQYVKHSPHISILLNLYEEHLDFFGNMKDYYDAKLNIFKYQDENDYAIYNCDNLDVLRYITTNNYKGKLYSVGSDGDTYIKEDFVYYKDNKLYNIKDKRNLLGSHNLFNIMCALTVAVILKLDIEKVIKTINSFKPLEHRMQFVGEYNGIKFYNDSIATIPAATIHCVDALKDVDTLIFGGMDRGIGFSEFVEYLKNSKIDNLICMPETGTKIGKILEKEANKNIYFVDTLEEAVAIAKKCTKKICVLSPASPSYNSFKNYIEKGNRYMELVRKN